MKRGAVIAAYLLLLVTIAEVFGQVAIKITSGTFPWADGGGRGGFSAGLFEPHPYLVGTPRRGAFEERDGISVRINQDGFRGPELHEDPPDSSVRILVLGGSTTFGTRVPQESTWPSQLEEVLSGSIQEAFPKQRLEVVNGGVPGYTSAENIVQLALTGVHLSPDLVVLFQGINDLHSAHSPTLRTDYSDFHGPSQWTSLELHRLKRGNRSGLVRLGREVLERIFVTPRLNVARGPRRIGFDERAENIFRSNLSTFASICTGRDMSCLFVPQVLRDGPVDAPWFRFSEIDQVPAALERYNEAMRQVADDRGLGFAGQVSLTAWTEQDFADSQHFSASGNRRFAELLAPQVLRLLSAPAREWEVGGQGAAAQGHGTLRAPIDGPW